MTCLVLAILVCLTALFIAGDACNQVPSMRWDDACLKACDTVPLYNLCQETLQRGPDIAEATAYAILATRLARMSYDDTVAQADGMLSSGTLPGDERSAYLHCTDRYATARVQMVSLEAELVGCDFTRARQQYLNAVAAVKSCGDGLSAFKGTALAAKNAADRDLTIVAYALGALIVGK